jgi:hypothetical protein
LVGGDDFCTYVVQFSSSDDFQAMRLGFVVHSPARRRTRSRRARASGLPSSVMQ